MTLNYEDSYVPQPYQGTLLVWAVTSFCVIFNVFLAKRLPFVEGVLLTIYVSVSSNTQHGSRFRWRKLDSFAHLSQIIGFFVIIIPLWVLAPISAPHDVFSTFNNDGGWSSIGVAVMVGMGGVVPSLAGFDCAVHMGT